jgi:hypothetical protein
MVLGHHPSLSLPTKHYEVIRKPDHHRLHLVTLINCLIQAV